MGVPKTNLLQPSYTIEIRDTLPSDPKPTIYVSRPQSQAFQYTLHIWNLKTN